MGSVSREEYDYVEDLRRQREDLTTVNAKLMANKNDSLDCVFATSLAVVLSTIGFVASFMSDWVCQYSTTNAGDEKACRIHCERFELVSRIFGLVSIINLALKLVPLQWLCFVKISLVATGFLLSYLYAVMYGIDNTFLEASAVCLFMSIYWLLDGVVFTGRYYEILSMLYKSTMSRFERACFPPKNGNAATGNDENPTYFTRNV